MRCEDGLFLEACREDLALHAPCMRLACAMHAPCMRHACAMRSRESHGMGFVVICLSRTLSVRAFS